jgi:hypothetical protein
MNQGAIARVLDLIEGVDRLKDVTELVRSL